MRGMLTEEIINQATELLGHPITQRELRLIPYIQYIMVNDQRIAPAKISAEERNILSSWRKLGYIEGGAGGMKISKLFWDAISEIMWLSYVGPDGQKEAS